MKSVSQMFQMDTQGDRRAAKRERKSPRTVTVTTAFKRGQDDFRRGVSRSACHYAQIEIAEAWERGWDDARERSRR